MRTVWARRPATNLAILLAVFALMDTGLMGFALRGSREIRAQEITAHQQIKSSDTELAKAREELRWTQKIYQTICRLHKKGSASRRELRIADYQRKIANLRFSAIEDPTKAQQAAIAAATLSYGFASKEVAILEKLHRRGSVSELAFRRAQTDQQIAKLRLDAARNRDKRKIVEVDIAKLRLSLSRHEFDKARRLHRTGSVSKATLDRLERQMIIAKNELAARRGELDVRVSVIQKDQ